MGHIVEFFVGFLGVMPMKSRPAPGLAGFSRIQSILGPAALAAALTLGAAGAMAASAEKGKVEFVRHGCWQCHGYEGQGGITGPKLAPDPIPLETLSDFIRTSNRAMPPFRKEILSDEDLADIYAYLQSVPKSPDPASIPLLNQ